ncbi:MAG: hypothetical protein J4452_00805 [Candidatus Aenigmarchaeota archaeon]|nr:hypothetical protein [Candidatus Aenigmarchaeota archaeon]
MTLVESELTEEKYPNAVFFNFHGCLIGNTNYAAHLTAAEAAVGPDFKYDLSRPVGERSKFLEKYQELTLSDENSRVSDVARKVITGVNEHGYKNVIWTSEHPKVILTILERDSVSVDYIESVHGYSVLEDGKVVHSKEYSDKLRKKAELLNASPFLPRVVVSNKASDIDAALKSECQVIDFFFALTTKETEAELVGTFTKLNPRFGFAYHESLETLLKLI